MRNRQFAIFIILFTLVVLYNSCQIFRNIEKGQPEYVIFPPPPDTARIQYLTSLSSSFDVVKKQSGFNKFIFGELPPSTISKPYGLNLRYNKLYICDIGIGGIEIIDFFEHTFEYFMPTGKGQLRNPVNCYVDEKGKMYIADSGRKQVVIFDKQKNYIDAIGDTAVFNPLDVFVSDNKIWIANLESNKIEVFQNDSTKKFLYAFPQGAKIGDKAFLYQPRDIIVTNNEVYVCDFGGFDVKVFSLNGEFIRTVGSQGMHPGQFARPKGIALDREENLYVTDATFTNAQIFNKNGQVLMFFGTPEKDKYRGYMYMPACVAIDYENVQYFEKFVDPIYKLKYLIFVANQYGTDKIHVYGSIELK